MVLKEIKNLKIKMRNRGFTLVEIMVSMAIFSLVMSVAVGVFTISVKSQRRILAQQELLNQTSYVLEYMSRALRMAKKDPTAKCIAQNSNYATTTHGILFKNYQGYCQEFYLDGTQLKSTETELAPEYSNLELTASALNVKKFEIRNSGWSQDPAIDNLQPSVTLFLEIEGKEKTKIQVQTTISKRNLDVQY
jgi:prepilin-type N-terminal cleavage/methylation domain-containing protein